MHSFENLWQIFFEILLLNAEFFLTKSSTSKGKYFIDVILGIVARTPVPDPKAPCNPNPLIQGRRFNERGYFRGFSLAVKRSYENLLLFTTDDHKFTMTANQNTECKLNHNAIEEVQRH